MIPGVRVAIGVVVLAACGRIGFEQRDGIAVPPESLPMGCAGTAKLAVGAGQTCVILDNVLRCWGRNFDGELGVGDRAMRLAPAESVMGSFATVGAGDFHTCAITPTNELYCFGQSTFGQIGDGEMMDRETPALVGAGWSFVAGGDDHSCGIKGDGSLWCWGRNDYGEAGAPSGGSILSPIPVGSDTDWLVAGCGDFHCCGLRGLNNGSVWCWGRNNNAQLGVMNQADTPTPVATALINIAKLAVGRRHNCAIDAAGTLSCWGQNVAGQLGIGNMSSPPLPMMVATNISAVAAGVHHTCVVDTGGALSCCGRNLGGQLGLGTSGDPDVSVLTRVGSAVWSTVYTSLDHNCAIGSGRIACWGKNDNGQLGTNDTVMRTTPTELCN